MQWDALRAPSFLRLYVTVKLMGFNALAPSRHGESAAPFLQLGDRLERSGIHAPAGSSTPEERPTGQPFGDSQRSGRAACALPVTLTTKWQTEFNSALAAPTVALGSVYVADPISMSCWPLTSTRARDNGGSPPAAELTRRHHP